MSALQKRIDDEERRALFRWKPKNGQIDVGDRLSKIILANVLGQRDRTLLDKRDRRQRPLGIGSVLRFARNGDTAWGSGVDGKIPADRHGFRQLDMRAMRGPRIRAFLRECGLQVPEMYGDPGLSMPLFSPRQALASPAARQRLLPVPHCNEPLDKDAGYKQRLVLPNRQPAAFVRQLFGADLVVSSSLHRLILAEDYGVPSVGQRRGPRQVRRRLPRHRPQPLARRVQRRRVRGVGRPCRVRPGGGAAPFAVELSA